MVYRTNDGKTGALDYREKAPLAASKNMYLDENGAIVEGKSTIGAMAIGIPGTVDGLFKVHEKFGTLPFSELIQPAIDLAKKGVIVTRKQAERLNKYRIYFAEANDTIIFLDTEWKENDTIKYSELAKTLERIRDNGRDGFYKGETAEILVNYIQKLGGIITKKDLEIYRRNPDEKLWLSIKDSIHGTGPIPSRSGDESESPEEEKFPFNLDETIATFKKIKSALRKKEPYKKLFSNLKNSIHQ